MNKYDVDRGKPKYSEKNLSQCHLVHPKSRMDWPGIGPVPPTILRNVGKFTPTECNIPEDLNLLVKNTKAKDLEI